MQIQNYVQTIIEVTKSVDGYQYRFEKIRTEDVLGDIKKQTLGLSEVFNLKINWEEQYISETANIVYDQVVRAVMNIIKKIFSIIPLDSHYIKSLQKAKFERDVVLNEALYDKVCFAGITIPNFKTSVLRHHPQYRFYDVGKLGTELCKRDVGKLAAIRYICRKKGVSISSVMAFGDNGNDVELLASCGYGVAMKNGSAQAKKAAKYISDYTNNEQGVLRFINSFFG